MIAIPSFLSINFQLKETAALKYNRSEKKMLHQKNYSTIKKLLTSHENKNDNLNIAKGFVCKRWRGFEFDSGWQRSVELPFEAIERGNKFYLPTRRHQLFH